MDEKALTVLKSMSDYLGGNETISFRAKTFFDVVEKASRESSVLLKRPNDLYIYAEGRMAVPRRFGSMARS